VPDLLRRQDPQDRLLSAARVYGGRASLVLVLGLDQRVPLFLRSD